MATRLVNLLGCRQRTGARPVSRVLVPVPSVIHSDGVGEEDLQALVVVPSDLDALVGIEEVAGNIPGIDMHAEDLDKTVVEVGSGPFQ